MEKLIQYKKIRVLVLLASNHSLPPTNKCSGISWLIDGTLNELKGFELTTISPYKGAPVNKIHNNYHAIYIYSHGWRDKVLLWLIGSIPKLLLKKWFFTTDPEKILRCLKVAREARKIDADIVISHVYPALFKITSRCVHKCTKHIFYYHGSLLQELPQDQLHFFSKYCNGLITNNKYSIRKSNISYRYFNFPVKSILNAVNTDFLGSKEMDQTIATSYEIDKNVFYIAYAGSLIPKKGVHVLIQAVVELINTNNKKINLMIIGEIPKKNDTNYEYYLKLREAASEHSKSIIFTGWIEHAELVLLFKYINLSVLLSTTQEGNSLFLMESITQGVPVIASRIGGIPEVVDENLTGLLVDNPGNVQEVKDKIFRLIQDPEFLNFMKINCRTISNDKFSYSRAAKELAEFLQHIVISS